MKSLHIIVASSSLIASIIAAPDALAGPPVTVTIKNLSTTAPANYQIVSSSERETYANSTPKPVPTIGVSSTDTYTVISTLSPAVNYAAVRYSMGSKQCQFYTSFTATTSNGVTTPSWSKQATPSNGAICTATTNSINQSTNAWAVTFTMK